MRTTLTAKSSCQRKWKMGDLQSEMGPDPFGKNRVKKTVEALQIQVKQVGCSPFWD